MLKEETYTSVPLVLSRGLLEKINQATVTARMNRSAYLRGIIERALAAEHEQGGASEEDRREPLTAQ